MQNHSLIFVHRIIFEKNTTPKSLVVKHPDFYYDFTTNDDRDMRI